MPTRAAGTRTIALVGPGGAGKTSLAEALLFAAGAIGRQGSVADGSSVGDASPEARARGGSTELNLVHFDYMGDRYAADRRARLGRLRRRRRARHGRGRSRHRGGRSRSGPRLARRADPAPARSARHPAHDLRQQDRSGARLDPGPARSAAADERLAPGRALDPDPRRRADLRLRRYRARAGLIITGPASPPSRRTSPPTSPSARRSERIHMLEQLADHDDALLEQLLMDEQPDRQTIFDDLAKETGQGQIVPVLFGSAQNGFGIRRLMKALRHDAPAPEAAAERLGASGACAFVFKVSHGGAMGRLSYARIFGGALKEGAGVEEQRRRDGAHRHPVRGAGREDRQAGQTPRPATWSRSPSRRRRMPANGWPPARRRPPRRSRRRCAITRSPSRPGTARTTSASRPRSTSLPRRIRALIWEQDEAMHETRLKGDQRRASQGHARPAEAALRRAPSIRTSRRSATRNRSARRSPSAAATRSSRAATASSAIA